LVWAHEGPIPSNLTTRVRNKAAVAASPKERAWQNGARTEGPFHPPAE
jgi:hypothetical protein